MKLTKYNSRTFQIVCWSTSVAMVCFLIAVCLTVFHVNLSQINGWLESYVQRIKWLPFMDLAPHLVNAPFWIPYWCAIILLFLYKERVRFMFWLNRFSMFGLLLTAILFVLNQAIRWLWPELCGRSDNFLHPQPYEGCSLFFVSGAVVAGICLLAFLCLRKRHWMVKVMLIICGLSLNLAALLQAKIFPLQLLVAIGIAAIAASIAYVRVALANEERFPELYKYLKP
ncbi:hypothetical protein DIU31_022580 [Mucilaginibacter rubeus]|uniref:Phosphatidic acid phosphatase type 2/haloperoxidase domain-containing protein n=2 Tax=Mucilaginibacter rubeus TaxID=2027860 RepID=A0A364WQA8_9SPHI|nr:MULTISPECIES: hypothetical protein [Mucilaginibacter]QEM06164.1 hypothetical protein DIU31_022580 [Mucilaginibacter rubeus]QEM13681.1 hypothetical protein DEO27_027935 [Mucilaginibacter rubeus]QEM18746.1 hypothetical protein DIU38_022815 [Mucilaginibacter gossypii]QTE36260.1 hypothetical protein J3L18_24485 [Mucilaginibacter gossypii]QTE44713.1 hypothetical protein J3L19_04910 [Mucilaginibacter rubeus]